MTEQLIDQATFNSMREMVGEDFIDELLETYFEDSPRLIAELRQSLIQGDTSAFQRAAHSLKSNSASFGAMGLAAQARELEYIGRDGQLDGTADKLAQLEATYQQVHQALREMT